MGSDMRWSVSEGDAPWARQAARAATACYARGPSHSSAMPPRVPRPQLRAVLVLLVACTMVCLGLPGTDRLRVGSYHKPKLRRAVEQEAGPLAPLVMNLIWLNDTVRMPLRVRMRPVERLFRIKQSWGLYGGGPSIQRSLVIFIDDEQVFALQEQEDRWIGPLLTHRRMRALVETMVEKPEALNWNNVGPWIVRRAQEDFPEAREVRMEAVWRSETAPPAIHHGRVARAPDWTLHPLGPDGIEEPSPGPPSAGQQAPALGGGAP